MTLADMVKQFMYTHMRQAPYAKELVKIVEAGELQYAQKIQELEAKLAKKQEEEESDFRDNTGRDWHTFD